MMSASTGILEGVFHVRTDDELVKLAAVSLGLREQTGLVFLVRPLVANEGTQPAGESSCGIARPESGSDVAQNGLEHVE